MICDPSYYSEFGTLDGTAIMMTPEEVIHSNLLQVEYAYRFVFSLDANFQAARKMCNNNPIFREVDRERLKDEWLNKDKFIEILSRRQKK